MLEDLIHEIRNDTKYDPPNFWRYRLSGNVLELSVLPELTKDRGVYRCTIISIGQILTALSGKIEDSKAPFLIQSFPNIESPEVIASIRIEEKKFPATQPVSVLNNSPDNTPLLETIEAIAAKFRLRISSVKTVPAPIQHELPENKTLIFFEIRSSFDNPFTWLNFGYFKETLQQLCISKKPDETLQIFDFCTAPSHSQLHKKINSSGYLQGYAAIAE